MGVIYAKIGQLCALLLQANDCVELLLINFLLGLMSIKLVVVKVKLVEVTASQIAFLKSSYNT